MFGSPPANALPNSVDDALRTSRRVAPIAQPLIVRSLGSSVKRSTQTFNLNSVLQSKVIPESAKRDVVASRAKQLKAFAALGPIAAAATPPSGQSCADSSLNNMLTVYGGVSCTVQELSPAFLGSCTWKLTTANSPELNVKFTPMTVAAGSYSTLTFSTPGNPTMNVRNYSAQATCGPGEVTYTIGVLPTPERPGPPGKPGPGAPPCGRCGPSYVGKPIDLANGELFNNHRDLELSGPFGLRFERSYASQTVGTTDMGAHWQHNYDAHLAFSQGSAAYYDETGLPYYFASTPAAGASVYENINNLTLSLDTTGSTYTVKAFSGQVRTFNKLGDLTSLSDRIGNKQTITRDTTTGHNDRILNVIDPLGRKLCFTSDTLNRVTSVSWLSSGTCPSIAPTTGTVVIMSYDIGTSCTTGQLCSVTEPDGRKWTYKYFVADPTFFTDLIEVDNPAGNPDEINSFAGQKVVQQISGACTTTIPCAETGSDLSFTYPGDLTGNVSIVDGQNRSSAMVYDPNTLLRTSVSGPICNCGGDQTRTSSYDANDRTTAVSDNGVDGTTKHSLTYTYGRDNGAITYPGATKLVENLDTSGTLRTTSYAYYPIGDARQDLVQTTTLPSVDVAGQTMTISDTYSTTGLLTQEAESGFVNGVSTTYTTTSTFDTRGRITSEVGPRTDVIQKTIYAYFLDTDGDPARAGQPQKVTDALGHATTYASATGFSSYDPYGHAQSTTDPNAVVRTSTFDAQGRPLTSTLLGVTGDTTNLVTTWTYDAAGRLASVQKPAGNGIAMAYDTSSRAVNLIRTDSSHLQQEQLALGYNANDQMTTLAAQSCASPTTACATWSTAFNESYGYSPTTSNLTQTTNADNTSKVFGYTAQGQLATLNDENHPTGSNYSNAFDLAGRRLAETRILAGATGGSVTTKYAYDLHDNVSSVADPNGNVTSYHNDDFDRVTKEFSPVQGTTSYTYNPANDLMSTTDANASTTAYTYDALDRELTEKATKSTTILSSTWKYDDLTAGHFGIGRTATMVDPSGSTTYRYERRGFVVSEARKIVGKSFAQDYSYDPNGNRASITYPDGRVVSYTYDFADRPQSATHSGTMTPSAVVLRASRAQSAVAQPEATANPFNVLRAPVTSRPSSIQSKPLQPAATLRTFTPQALAIRTPAIAPLSRVRRNGVSPLLTPSADVYVSAASYLPFGPLSSIAYGNGTVQTLARNGRYFPVENKLVSGAATLSDHVYAEDAVGNITAISDALDSGYARSFGYDDLNRLTAANSGAKLWGTATGNGYTYDAMGNLKSATLGSVYASTFAYKAGATGSVGLPKLSSVVENGTSRTVSYDAFGNETADGKATFTYSPRELLGADSTQIASYYYDGNRQRVSTTLKNGNSRNAFFDPQQHMLAETAQFTSATTSPAITEEYVWFGDAPVAQIDGATTRWTYADHLGTPQIQTDLTGAVQWQAEYQPYGTIETLRKNDVHQPLRFPGQVSEQFDTGANGLTERSFNNARWYRPNWGRYTQGDPSKLRAGMNLFQYAESNPISLTDFRGLDVYIGYHSILGTAAGHLFFIINDGPGGPGEGTTISGEWVGIFLQSQDDQDFRSRLQSTRIHFSSLCEQEQAEARLRTANQNYQHFHNHSNIYLMITENSNSFFHGIGNAAHIPLPSDPAAFLGNSSPWFYPGYNQMIPPSNFGP